MKLVIVESPTKARTLSSFLDKSYRVEATLGHVRDLPEKKLGVEVKRDFKPFYLTIPSKKKRVFELKKLAHRAAKIILATDPDREGEAIAYHVAVLLLGEDEVRRVSGTHFFHSALASSKTGSGHRFTLADSWSKTSSSPHCKNGSLRPSKLADSPRLNRLMRIVFHEITPSAIKEALEHPRRIDLKLVNAQVARRVLDRLVGYKLSPLLWAKIGRRWLSAGRVQSVAARLVVERERERERFEKEEYWRISSKFKVQSSKLEIEAELVAKNGERYEKTLSFDLFDGKYKVTKTTIETKAQAEKIINQLRGHSFKVVSLDKKEVKRIPPPPFVTSTLQQEANRTFGFSSKRTMTLAQRLYEKGLITYHRTDSVFLSEKFLIMARKFIKKFIKKMYGEKYLPAGPRRYKTKSKLAQEAHEAIRPTRLKKFEIRKSKIEKDLTRDHLKLYDLIFRRAVASQAKEAVIETTKIGILSDNGYLFEAKGSVIKFDGFLKILGRRVEDKILPSLKVGETLKLIEALPTQHFTTPPPRYSEASLIKTLEKLGIGRPSTYAPTISTILERQYIEREEGKFVPTMLGETVNDFLVAHFPKIIDIPFTAEMEDNLDKIAKGEKEWVPVVREFYLPFETQLKKVYQKAEKVKLPTEETEESCPKCQSKLVIRIGKFGKFLACSSFPECDYTAPFLEKTGLVCPQCGAELVIKKTKRGKRFYGCSNYPKCQFASWKKPKSESVS